MRSTERPYTEPYGVLATSEQVEDILTHLREHVDTMEDGRAYLNGIIDTGKIDIRPVAQELGLKNAKRLSPRHQVEDILQFTVQARLNSEAIRKVKL